MKRFLFDRSNILVPIIGIAALFITIFYSNSSKTVLIKDNVEAISESNGNDPTGALALRICYDDIKPKSGEKVKQCMDGTTAKNVLPCKWVENNIPETDASSFHCWHQYVYSEPEPLFDWLFN